MGDMFGWDADRWQTVASLVGAATGVFALGVSAFALWLAQAGSRAAALVLTWRADDRLTLENRGPAAARDVLLEVATEGQLTEPSADLPDHVKFEVRQQVSRLPVGYAIQDSLSRRLGSVPSNYVATITWRDGRRGEQRLELPMTQERGASLAGEEPVLSNRQVRALADGLASGMAHALKEHLENRERRFFNGF